MNKQAKKRRKIFEIYSNQLNTLKQMRLLNLKLEYEQTYICPICLKQFNKEALQSKKLTLEDAPPKSLGGNANTLTCAPCNNGLGHAVDSHLSGQLRKIDVRSLMPNTEAKIRVKQGNKTIQGKIKVDGNRKISIVHEEKSNHPVELEKYISSLNANDIITIKYVDEKYEKSKFAIALLKTGYLLAFEKFGYSVILKNFFDPVREQLSNPEQLIYPEGFYTQQSNFNYQDKGVFLLTSDGYEGWFIIFMLRTKIGGSNGYGVYLPINLDTYKDVIDKLRVEKIDSFNLLRFDEKDYFNDINNIHDLNKMISKYCES